MCGRYAQGESASGLEEIYDIHIPPGVAIVPSWNVAPMQRAPIVGFDAAVGGRALRRKHPVRTIFRERAVVPSFAV